MEYAPLVGLKCAPVCPGPLSQLLLQAGLGGLNAWPDALSCKTQMPCNLNAITPHPRLHCETEAFQELAWSQLKWSALFESITGCLMPLRSELQNVSLLSARGLGKTRQACCEQSSPANTGVSSVQGYVFEAAREAVHVI